MAQAAVQENWHDAANPYDNTINYNQAQAGFRNIVDICRQLASRDSRRPDKETAFVRDVLKALFYERTIDLCSIRPSSAYDNPYVAVQELIDSSSHFFNVFFDAHEKFAEELWNAMYYQIQSCNLPTNATEESVAMYCLSGYVIRLLPTETQTDRPVQRNTIRQKVHTPLDLFLANSPVLNRIRFETEGSEADRTMVQPRHLKMFCNLVTIFCSTEEFPSPSRLMVLRHLVKQFHVFCTFETVDSDMLATKRAVLANPPFAGALYQFLYTFLDQCPSPHSLQDIIGIWLTFCRPWRYYAEEPQDLPNSIFEPFIRNQEKYYRILLGKIMRKLSELDISVETSRTMKAILECTWKEPMYTVVRKLLSLDCRPAARKVLDRIASTHKMELVRIKSMEQAKASESWWQALMHPDSDPQLPASKALIAAIDPILKDADAYMHTNFLSEKENISKSSFSPLATTVTDVFEETPKRGYLPDHEIDETTGLLYATPLGRKQIFEKERSFDFSQCKSYVPRWQTKPRDYEFAPMVYATRYIANLLNKFEPIQDLGKHYYDKGLLGNFIRIIMDPPCPNLRTSVTSPVFSKELIRTPPTLRLRILANNNVLITILFFILYCVFGLWFLLILGVFLIFILLIYLNEQI